MSYGRISGCSVIVLLALGATAAAADDTSKSAPAIAGYVEAHGGEDFGSSTHYDPGPDGTGTWSDYIAGGSGRVGVVVAPNFSVQGDIWTDTFYPTDNSAPGTDSGIAGHLSWRSTDDAALLGVLASVGMGGTYEGTVGNVGLEGAINLDNFRFYGQAGLTSGLSGDAATNGERDLYATLSASYFVDPNFVLSANIGADNWTQSNGDTSPEMSWGAKIEFKPDGSPISFFAAYQGFGFRSNYNGQTDYDAGTDHMFFIGARIPLGASTLQDTQRAAGLSDLNPSYGDLINR
jgi:hypothetical protein